MIGGVECDNALRKWLARKKYDRDVAAGARDGEEEDDDGRPSVVCLEDDELLYRLFELLCLGGPLAQPDLELDPYLKATKALYRDCVQVRKRSSDGATCLANEAYEVAGPLVFGNGPAALARAVLSLRSPSGPRRHWWCSRRRGGCGNSTRRYSSEACD